MDRMIYLSMSGAKATMQRQDVLANNLANASTVGFRSELQAFRAVPVRGDGASTRVYALETSTGYNADAGPITSTGRKLDVAMQGKAWLAVQGLDGTEAYTRGGALDVTSEGQLVTRGGLPVLGDGGPITLPPNAEPSIAPDGTISARQANGTVTPVGKLKLVTPETPLSRGDDGLFRLKDGSDAPVDAAVTIGSGVLESSNVNAAAAMVNMIELARQFEMQVKAIRTAEENAAAASQLMRMG